MQAFLGVLTFAFGGLVGYVLARALVGRRKWREGYLYGFNLAWDEKAKIEQDAKERQLKQIRRSRPRFQVIKGDKP